MQAYDRYAYVNNNPLRYTDPSGHSVDCGIGENCVGKVNPNDNKKADKIYIVMSSGNVNTSSEPDDERGYQGCVTSGTQGTQCTSTLIIVLNSNQNKLLLDYLNTLDNLGNLDVENSLAQYVVQELTINQAEITIESLAGAYPAIGFTVGLIENIKQSIENYEQSQIDQFSDDFSILVAGNTGNVVIVIQTGYFNEQLGMTDDIYIYATNSDDVTRTYQSRYTKAIVEYFFAGEDSMKINFYRVFAVLITILVFTSCQSQVKVLTQFEDSTSNLIDGLLVEKDLKDNGFYIEKITNVQAFVKPIFENNHKIERVGSIYFGYFDKEKAKSFLITQNIYAYQVPVGWEILEIENHERYVLLRTKIQGVFEIRRYCYYPFKKMECTYITNFNNTYIQLSFLSDVNWKDEKEIDEIATSMLELVISKIESIK